MDSHQAYAVLLGVVLFHLIVGEQRHVFHETHKVHLGGFTGGFVHLLVAEFHDGVEQFLDVLHAADALGCVFLF